MIWRYNLAPKNLTCSAQPQLERNVKKVVLMLLVSLGMGSVIAAGDDNQALIDRIKPVGNVHVKGAAAANAGGARSGLDVYSTSCIGCHASGALGAPKTSSKADWQPRIDARGLDTLLSNAINGYNAMPAMGACGDCSDDEIKASIEHMLKFK